MKGYRTLLFNGLMAAFAVLSYTGVLSSDNAPDASALNGFLDHLDAIVLFVTPVGNAILRFFTNTAVAKKF